MYVYLKTEFLFTERVDMKIIGLTGKTGSGKSTVSRILSEKGYGIVDADVIARKVVETGSPLLKILAENFGKEVINADGSLNRKELSKRGFATKEATEKLNALMHPMITDCMENEIKKLHSNGFEKIIVDAAALLESGFDKKCDKIVVVSAPYDVRLKRILSRDNLTEEAARLRMDAQKCDEYYTDKADVIIRNYEPYNLEDEVRKAENEI